MRSERGRQAGALPLCTIAGAPKTATTSIAEALRRHPELAFSTPKEPFWYGSDLEPLRRREGIDSRDAYLRTFGRSGRAAGAERWRIDGSTLYMSSPDALEQLAADEPEARVVCSLRDPVEVAQAFHAQMVFTGFEPCGDFADAWRRQEARRERPEARCPVPRLLQYADLVALGSQLRAALELFGPDRLHVVIFDDFQADSEAELRRLASFLGIDPAAIGPAPSANASMVARSALAGRAVRSRPARRAAAWAKQTLPDQFVGTLNAAKTTVVRRAAPRAPLDPAVEQQVRDQLAPEVALLEQLLGRDLGAWRRARARPSVRDDH